MLHDIINSCSDTVKQLISIRCTYVAMFYAMVVVVVVVLSLSTVETVAVSETCITSNNGSPIDNCCDLRKLAQLAFSEIAASVNKPKVYKLKNFCDKNCTTVIINGYCDTLAN